MGICCGKPSSKPKEGLFTNLPRDMTLEILGRLPIRSIITCKYVCKAWRVIIEGGSLSRTRKLLVTFELYGPCSRSPPFRRVLHRLDNGLHFVERFDHLFVVNEMTYKSIMLPLPRRKRPKLINTVGSIYECKISGQYKILYGYLESGSWSYYAYTLGGTGGRGVWRRIEGEPGNPTRVAESFFSGNWHMIS